MTSQLRSSYKELQESASATVSAAVSESSQMFNKIMEKHGLRTTTDSKPTPSTTKSARPVIKAKCHDDQMYLNPVVPLVGEGNHDSTFVCLITELMRPHGPIEVVVPRASSPSVTTPSAKSHSPANRRQVKPPTVPFGSARPRFEKKATTFSNTERNLPSFGTN